MHATKAPKRKVEKRMLEISESNNGSGELPKTWGVHAFYFPPPHHDSQGRLHVSKQSKGQYADMHRRAHVGR